MDKRFREARRQLVAKRSDMVTLSRSSLGLVENKAVLYILSKVQPNDTPDKVYRFDCEEFFRIIKWKKRSYSELKGMLQSIANKSWWINETDDPDLGKLCRWFNVVNIEKSDGEKYVSIKFHETIFPYILNLQEQKEKDGKYFLTYQLQNISLMSHVTVPGYMNF